MSEERGAPVKESVRLSPNENSDVASTDSTLFHPLRKIGKVKYPD